MTRCPLHPPHDLPISPRERAGRTCPSITWTRQNLRMSGRRSPRRWPPGRWAPTTAGRCMDEATALVRAARRGARRQGVVESFLQEFALSHPRGPGADVPGRGPAAHARRGDPRPADRREDRARPTGRATLGQSDSLFVNASTWGLMLTGKLIDAGRGGAAATSPGFITRLAGRLGEPVIRRAVGAGGRASWASSSCWAAPSRRRIAPRRAGRLRLLLRHAGRGRPHRGRRRALRGRLRRGAIEGRRQARRRRRARRPATASR